MDHVVYLNTKAKEFDKLITKTKSCIIRGGAGRKMPYGRVFKDDVLYFISNNGEGLVKAKAMVTDVYNSTKMTTEESIKLVDDNSDKLQLSALQHKRWAGKKYLVLISIDNFKEIEPFKIDKSNYGSMEDWLPVEDIERVKT
ncbi:hypothetical protein KHQ81_09005 [Mycoplasmatota bacterium]|nr:hypothetical protein KHQ81_09005 [Mycoplasmatota bacterium]